MPKFPDVRARCPAGARALRLALAVSFTTTLPGCMAWKAENVAPVQALKTPVPATLRVTLVDGETRYLDDARIEHDSLIGNARPTRGEWRRDQREASVHIPGKPGGRTAFPLSQVVRTEAQRVHAGKTLLVVVPTAAVAGFLVLLSAYSGLE